MGLPKAIRKDNDPFSAPPVQALGILRPLWPLPLLAFLRCTSYSCPHCYGVFRIDYWPNNIRLGNGERICRKCGKMFDDESREWPELRWTKKLRFFLPPGVQAVTGGLLFCAIFTLLIAPRNVVNIWAVLLVVSVFVSPVLLRCVIRFVAVIRSNHRFKFDPNVQRRLLASA